MLRPAGEQDLERMRRWRNQPANREVSNHEHLISAEEHRAWWQQVTTDPSRQVLVFEIDGDPCGVVTFFDLETLDLVEGGGTPGRRGAWGFYLDHDGLRENGTALVAWNRVMGEAIGHAFDELGLDLLTAEVLEQNHAVRSTNRRFRFVEGTPRTTSIEDRKLTVIPVSLRREDRRRPRSAQHVQDRARPDR